jgi:hypothetical protein
MDNVVSIHLRYHDGEDTLHEYGLSLHLAGSATSGRHRIVAEGKARREGAAITRHVFSRSTWVDGGRAAPLKDRSQGKEAEGGEARRRTAFPSMAFGLA